MKGKKTVFISILAILLSFLLTACSGSKDVKDSSARTCYCHPDGLAFKDNDFGYAYKPGTFQDVSAAVLVANIRVGWNLGNTFDAPGETAWGNPATTKKNMDTLKGVGFNAIRIPVSWSSKSNSSFVINDSHMKRIKDVVDYVIDNEMFAIINSHHDNRIFKFNTQDELNASKAALKKIWEQIADVFKDYPELLIFEGLNEPRTERSPAEWSGGTPQERANLNELNKVFVETIRAGAGNNPKRILMIPTYAASAEAAAMNDLVVPPDPASDKIVVSIHSYTPYNFALNQGAGRVNRWSVDNSSDTSAITTMIDRANSAFVSKGIPVIMGEFGAVDRNNEADRAAWVEYYISYARSRGIKCILWDNGGFSGDGELFGFFNRNFNTFKFDKMLDAMMCAAYNKRAVP
jgi:endoglucanase